MCTRLRVFHSKDIVLYIYIHTTALSLNSVHLCYLYVFNYFIFTAYRCLSQGTWEPYNDTEYYFGVLFGESNMNWHSARHYCMDNGGDLISFDDESEREWVSERVG